MTNQSIFTITSHIAEAFIALGALTGLVRWKKLGESQKVLLILLVLALFAELITRVLVISEIVTYPVFHFYAVVEYALLAKIFIQAFNRSKVSIVLRWSIPIMVVFAIVNTSLWQPLSSPNTNFVMVSGLILIAISTLFLFRTLNRMTYQHIEKSALFWMSIGVLVYFASTILMFAFLTKLVPWDMKFTGSVLILNAVFNIIHYICFTIALWMKPE